MKLNHKKDTLRFLFEAGTSRGTMTTRDTWTIHLQSDGITGIGECAPLNGLSQDPLELMEVKLMEVSDQMLQIPAPRSSSDIRDILDKIDADGFPSIMMGMEMALLDLLNEGKQKYFQNDFSDGKSGIPINGLIWMGDHAWMMAQAEDKLKLGFDCLKMKVGALDFDLELSVLHSLRKRFDEKSLILRVDANGAFGAGEAMYKLKELAKLKVHSIEQPLKKGMKEATAALCDDTPVPIALDEELIGESRPEVLLKSIRPQFIILKPTLLGGFGKTDGWIREAGRLNIGWWATSALESNYGLRAIAQFTGGYHVKLHQGLGTGKLYENNIGKPLTIREGIIFDLAGQ